MGRVDVRRAAGWAAYVSMGLSIISSLFLILFFTVEVPGLTKLGGLSYGTINDTATIFLFMVMLILPIALHQLATGHRPRLSQGVAALGLIGMLIVIVAQVLLVVRVIPFEVNLPIVMPGFGLFGLWMLLVSRLGRTGGSLPPRLGRVGEIVGAAYLASAVLTLAWLGLSAVNAPLSTQLAALAQTNVVVLVVVGIVVGLLFLTYLFGIIVWLLGLGRWLLRPAAAGTVVPQRG